MEGQRLKLNTAQRYAAFAVFLLLCALLIASVLIVASGARVYRSVERQCDADYAVRTLLQYVAGKARAAEAVRVTEDGVLVLPAQYGGTQYETYVYCKDGSVCEYFGPAAEGLLPERGEAVAQCERFSVSLEGELLCVSASAEGAEGTLHIFLAGGAA